MKITVNTDNDKEEWVYPCLVINEDAEILLAIKDNIEKGYFEGYFIKGCDRPIWQHGNSWYKEHFKLWKGFITLSND